MSPLLINQLQLNGTEVSIWQIALNAPADDQLLSPDEIARADRLIMPVKRQQFIAARAGLRVILGNYTGSPPESLIFGYQARGKPYLRGSYSCEFSLSHSGDTALVAVAQHPVGIDIEREQPLSTMMHMAQITFSPQEQADWIALPVECQSHAFYQTWTRKEALMKAHGDGFKLAKTFSIPVTEQPQTIKLGRWMIADISLVPEFIGAVAVGHAPLLKSILG
jgi:4'-phosphopantetheinyl transferase